MAKQKFRQTNYEPRYYPVAVVKDGEVHALKKVWGPDVLESLCNNMVDHIAMGGARSGCPVLVLRQRMFQIARWLPDEEPGLVNSPVYCWQITNRFTSRKKNAAIMAMLMIAARDQK